MLSVLESINRFVWGIPGVVMIMGVGIYLSLLTNFSQLRLMPKAIRFFCRSSDANSRSSRKALCTALAATVGTGNLAGVAGAIALGGPGAVFWMWICGLLGMVIKFAEATLSVHYRVLNERGEYIGGPMHIIRMGLSSKWHWMAGVYCFFGLVASFGVGNATQINTVIRSIQSACIRYGVEWSKKTELLIGAVLALIIGLLLGGGGARIGSVAHGLVPVAAISYILLCTFVLTVRAHSVPGALMAIIKGAVSPKAVTGGVIGSCFISMRVGACRGVFTNEAGMGTAGIAHGNARVNHPVEQGYMGIVEVFIDTILICTLTALVVLCSGVSIPYGTDPGITLTNDAFGTVCGSWIYIFISVSLSMFAIATVLGWGYYGGRCAQYLFGDQAWKKYVVAQVGMVLVASVLKSEYLWTFSELLNGLMSIPNLVAIMILTPVFVKLLKENKQDSASKS